MTDRSPDALHPIARDPSAFARHLVIRMVFAEPHQVEAEMEVTSAHLNRNGVLHGGAIMALADTVGGTGTFLNLKEGEGTTTIESKTNFFRAVPAGDKARAIAVPLHLGRRMQVWQTTILRGDGKVAALVTQTQMVLPPGDRS
ncbi:PaaI family thioesterase [Tabrizicola sp. J26]|uniref:PaaI family thioesterase n=1 Tax=Alitabrizicola rongguiensis TaxID=2909234 RepID=UPI001F26516F|nr:PaaI family thioesterase [Tabrizicola rongguiensis]MCF1710897.1 PaaI family thioesterase [Tabrizicola rongguiensis]